MPETTAPAGRSRAQTPKPNPIGRHKPARDISESMRFVLLITASSQQPGAWHAYHLARALLSAGHALTLFFYGDAVQTANRLRFTAQDEPVLADCWAKLATDYTMELPVCVAAAMRRGLTDSDNARRHQLDGDNLHPAFRLAGLGELTEALTLADRTITLAG
jgi:tRNA 2-thiouridine synthesizing protein D